jgi:hypothetical protein
MFKALYFLLCWQFCCLITYGQSTADTIAYFLERHPSYKRLDIDANDLQIVASVFRQIDEKDTAWAEIALKVREKRVVDLSITGLNKTFLPSQLYNLTALEGLAIKGCYWYELPNLSRFKKLKYLGIWSSRLRGEVYIDESYTNLEVFGIHQSKINYVRFAKGLHIKTLYLIDAQLKHIDTSIENLQELTEIHLGGNELTDFDLSALPALKKINCYKNNIQVVLRKRLRLKHKNIEVHFDEY